MERSRFEQLGRQENQQDFLVFPQKHTEKKTKYLDQDFDNDNLSYVSIQPQYWSKYSSV